MRASERFQVGHEIECGNHNVKDKENGRVTVPLSLGGGPRDGCDMSTDSHDQLLGRTVGLSIGIGVLRFKLLDHEVRPLNA